LIVGLERITCVEPEQFTDAIKTAVFAPMHFGEKYKEANAFCQYAESADCRFIPLDKTDVSIDF
jgi:hypothetical protein